jgi:uncharacterized protein YukJ
MSTDEEFMATWQNQNGREPDGFVLIRSDPRNPWARLFMFLGQTPAFSESGRGDLLLHILGGLDHDEHPRNALDFS